MKIKKIFTFLVLSLVFMSLGTVDVNAKPPVKKKATTSAPIKFKMMDDGYADISGHTYQGNLQGINAYFTFYNNGTYNLRVKYQGQWEEEMNEWGYLGEGDIELIIDGVLCYLEIRDGGKVLYSEDANTSFKAIK